MVRRPGWAAVLAGAALLSASAARAQTSATTWSDGGIAADRLEPTPPGDPFFGVPSPFVGGRATPRVSLLFDYAHRPLVLSSGSAGSNAIIGSQSFVRVGFSFAIVDRLLLSLELPIALFQSGDAPTSPNTTIMYKLPESPIPGGKVPFRPAVGDLRLGTRVRVFGEEADPFQIAMGYYLHIPSFMASSILREPSVRHSPHVTIGGRYELLVWSAAVGAVLRGGDVPSTITYGAGAAFVLEGGRLNLGAELFAITPVRAGVIPVAAGSGPIEALTRPATTGAELLFDARVRAGPMVLGASAGPGFGGAPGTPAYRVLGLLAFSPLPPEPPEPPPGDTDEDGIADNEDACPSAFGPSSGDPRRNGCPARDRDGDGVPDDDDKCPDRAGSRKTRGCPPDRDGDGVPDDVDVCPDVEGTAETAGCADEDGDGVPDAEDACPKEKGSWHVDPMRNGCPAALPAGQAKPGEAKKEP